MDISSTSSSILPCIFFVFLFLPGSVDATWRISSSSLRMCARQDSFVFERPQVVFYCNFSSSRHVSKSDNLIGRIVFDAVRQTKKTKPRRFFKNDAFTRGVFRVGVHTHIGALCLVTRCLKLTNIARKIRPGVYRPLEYKQIRNYLKQSNFMKRS